LLAVMLVVRRGRSWAQAMAESANPFPRFTLNATVSAMMSLLIVVLVRDVSRWSVVLVAIPLWLSHSAQQSARVAQDRAEQLTARVRELEMLNSLSGELLSVHDASVVAPIASEILGRALERGAVTIDLTGDTAAGATHVEIPGAAPASIVLTDESDAASNAVLEAAASLIGLTLTRLEVEAELAETERARTALTGRIREEATHARSRIAMSVHDDVLPLFAAAQMQIDNAEMLLEIDDREQAAAVIDKATSAVSDGIRSLRDTLEALRGSTLVPGTVVAGARRLMADLQARTGIRSQVDAPDPMPELPFAVELLAYETLRGCLANIEKHSHATIVHVEFRCDAGRLVLLMQDDGRGFDPTAIGRRSHGLALMRQRAELARGSFDITGTPGAGTATRLEVPTW
jgi:signal transduction histidine kinase